jgi:hypothetical protein
MAHFASSVSSWVEKPEQVMAILVMDVLNIPVDKLRVVHPTPGMSMTRRVDDALFIHHCGDCPGYLLSLGDGVHLGAENSRLNRLQRALCCR